MCAETANYRGAEDESVGVKGGKIRTEPRSSLFSAIWQFAAPHSKFRFNPPSILDRPSRRGLLNIASLYFRPAVIKWSENLNRLRRRR